MKLLFLIGFFAFCAALQNCLRVGLFYIYLNEFDKDWLTIVKHYKSNMNRICDFIARNESLDFQKYDDMEQRTIEYLLEN